MFKTIDTTNKFRSLSSHQQQLLILGAKFMVLGIMVPNLIFRLGTALLSTTEVAHLNLQLPVQPYTLTDFLPSLTGFINIYCLGLLIVLVITGSTYFSLLQVALDFRKNSAQRPWGKRVWRGFKQFTTRSFSFLLLLVILVLSAQVFSFPAVILGTLSLMLPTAIIFTNNKTFPAFWLCITLKYVPHQRWRAFTRVITMGTGIYLVYFGMNWLVDSIGQIAEFWRVLRPSYQETLGTQIPIHYLLRAVWDACLFTLVLSGLAVFSVKLYDELSQTLPLSDPNA